MDEADCVHQNYSSGETETVWRQVALHQPHRIKQPQEHGPFDIVGDVHGCYDELLALLAELGYEVRPAGSVDVVR